MNTYIWFQKRQDWETTPEALLDDYRHDDQEEHL